MSEDRDRHQIYVRAGDTFSVRAQDGERGACLGRYRIVPAPGGGIVCRQIARPCGMCRGQCLVKLTPPRLDYYGPGKHLTHAPCPRCTGSGLVSIALESMS